MACLIYKYHNPLY
uniref:Uncharacterized protein n=1 Tax=Anguilla anguilla TaxID=7936 RepID=A0A0E9TWC4_ANGAN